MPQHALMQMQMQYPSVQKKAIQLIASQGSKSRRNAHSSPQPIYAYATQQEQKTQGQNETPTSPLTRHPSPPRISKRTPRPRHRRSHPVTPLPVPSSLRSRHLAPTASYTPTTRQTQPSTTGPISLALSHCARRTVDRARPRAGQAGFTTRRRRRRRRGHTR